MSRRLLTRPEVEADINQAAAWYEQQRSGLGAEFAREIWRTIDTLADNSLLYRVQHRVLRWIVPKRFPYRIVFTVGTDCVVIHCVVHAKRLDRHWKERI